MSIEKPKLPGQHRPDSQYPQSYNFSHDGPKERQDSTRIGRRGSDNQVEDISLQNDILFYIDPNTSRYQYLPSINIRSRQDP